MRSGAAPGCAEPALPRVGSDKIPPEWRPRLVPVQGVLNDGERVAAMIPFDRVPIDGAPAVQTVDIRIRPEVPTPDAVPLPLPLVLGAGLGADPVRVPASPR